MRFNVIIKFTFIRKLEKMLRREFFVGSILSRWYESILLLRIYK